jgi:hypothetical protein
MSETTTIVLENSRHICQDSEVCLHEIKDDMISVIEHIWNEQREDYITKDCPDDHIFLKTAAILRKIDFIEVQNLIHIRTGNVSCKQCGKMAVPEYTLKDYFYNPKGLIPHVVYGTCRKCNHDQSDESF